MSTWVGACLPASLLACLVGSAYQLTSQPSACPPACMSARWVVPAHRTDSLAATLPARCLTEGNCF